MKLNWTINESVGVVEIDNQHKHIFNLINTLSDSIRGRYTEKEISKTLDELVNYSKTHFKVEEYYFDKFNYELKTEHIIMHHFYIARVATFLVQKNNDMSKYSLPIEVVEFLEDWWINHINVEDKKYTQIFHQHGLF